MQCPNCYADTNAALPHCTRCDASLPQWRSSPPAPRSQQPVEQPFEQPVDPVERPYAPDDGPGQTWGREAYWQPGPGDPRSVPLADEPESWPATGPPTPPPRRVKPLLLATIALIIGGLAVGVFFWRSLAPPPAPRGTHSVSTGDRASAEPSGSPAEPQVSSESTDQAVDVHDQAAAIDGLLDEMASSRAELGPAITSASRCDGIDDAITTLEQVEAERQDQFDKARALQVDAIDQGDEIRDALTRAADYSRRADREFLAWAQTNAGCTERDTPADDHFDRGQDISRTQAGPAKREFTDLWNPVAEQEGLSARSADDF